jgi:HEAT repeat protein
VGEELRNPLAEGATALDWEDPSSLPVAEVEEFFLTLAKALRAFQLYDRNNPVYHRFLSNLRQAVSRLWLGQERLPLLVEEDRITWQGEQVYQSPNRAESLSFLLFRDGVRELTLKKGLEQEELEGFLEVLHRARHARGDSDDLVTLLWDQDFRFLEYGVTDFLAEGVAVPERGDGGLGNPRLILEQEGVGLDGGGEDRGEAQSMVRERAPELEPAFRVQDFNPALYALDPADREYLDAELRLEMERDLRIPVLNALFDRLEENSRPDRQEEITEILRSLLPGFLSQGELDGASRVLEELESLRARGLLSDAARERADQILDELASGESVRELVGALEDGSVSTDATELAGLLRHLRAPALAPLLAATEETAHPIIRRLLQDAIRKIAASNPQGVLRLLEDPDPAVAAGAVRLLEGMGLSEAAGSLARLLDRGALRVQLAVVEVAGEIPSSALAGALERSLTHQNRDLRVGAARALGRTRYAPAAERLQEILKGKDLRSADVTEKVVFFEAYARLAGERGIPFLDRLLNGKGILGFREPPEIRAAAARALGVVGTDAAYDSLERARDEQDPVVRSAVNRSLRGE